MSKAKGAYKEFLDSTRAEYERAMYGRRTTDDLDLLGQTPEQAAAKPAQNTQDDDLDRQHVEVLISRIVIIILEFCYF